MRQGLSVLLFLLPGLALCQGAALRPLPIASTRLPGPVTAMSTDQRDLERAGYNVKDSGSGSKLGQGRERSYTFEGLAGSTVTLTDQQYPEYVLAKRRLVLNVIFSVKEGRSASDLSEIAPRLIAAAQEAVSGNIAVVAGLGYLATASESGVRPRDLQDEVIDYLERYRQPSTPLHEPCAGCGSLHGLGDSYYGGPDVYTRLNVGDGGWRIAGIRHYLNGDSTFRLEIVAKIPRS